MSKQTKFGEEIRTCNSLTLSEANPLAFKVITLVDAYLNPVELVGSARRLKPVVRDIDLVGVGSVKGWKWAKDSLVTMLDAKGKMRGPKIVRVWVPFVRGYVQLDIYRATEDDYALLKLIRTGSAEHNIWLAKRAIKMGMRLLYSKGLMKDGEVIPTETERDVFNALDLEYIIPSEREIVKGKPKWMK